MSTYLYKDGEEVLIDAEQVPEYLQMGYTVTNEVAIPNLPNADAELEAARELYFEHFSKKAHHKMTTETILAKLEA